MMFDFFPHKMDNSVTNMSVLFNYIAETNDFSIVGERVVCNYCEKTYIYNPAEGLRNLKRHASFQSHVIKKSSKIQSLDNANSQITLESRSKKEFDLLFFMVKMNHSLSDLSNPIFRNFFDQYVNIPLASESYYRKTLVPEAFKMKRECLFNLLNEKDFYLIVDSSVNSQGKNILSIIIGICSPNVSSEKYLLDIVELTSSTASSYVEKIIQVLIDAFGNITISDYFKLIITDQAANMLKLGKLLKDLYPNILHITCLAHMIHNICEKIRDNARRVDTIVVLLKKYLNKNKTNQKIFYEKTSLIIPNWPIITRWGTWLEFVKWVFYNYDEISKFIKEMDSKYKKNDFILYDSEEFEKEIRFCNNYSWQQQKSLNWRVVLYQWKNK